MTTDLTPNPLNKNDTELVDITNEVFAGLTRDEIDVKMQSIVADARSSNKLVRLTINDLPYGADPEEDSRYHQRRLLLSYSNQELAEMKATGTPTRYVMTIADLIVVKDHKGNYAIIKDRRSTGFQVIRNHD